METSELIERFLEETNYNHKEEVMLIMAYGSRITKKSTSNSDLDILIITSKKTEYRQSRIIDGILVDVTIIPIEEAKRQILYSNMIGSTYFDSVLKTGIIILNKYNTFDNLSDLLNQKIHKKRYLEASLLEKAQDHYDYFISQKGEENIHYYSCLELLRRLYHAKQNCSNIRVTKVYDLYKDLSLIEQYMIKLPDKKFIENYLEALKEKDKGRQKQILIDLLKEFENCHFKKSDSIEYFGEIEIKRKLISLNKIVIKCEDLILRNHPYAFALYNMILGEISNLYEKINHEELKLLPVQNDQNQMILNLETLFCKLGEDFEIDYDDYTMKW